MDDLRTAMAEIAPEVDTASALEVFRDRRRRDRRRRRAGTVVAMVVVLGVVIAFVANALDNDRPATVIAGTGEQSFGHATVSPSTASAGDTITVTAAGQVEPICLGYAIVNRSTASGLEKVGALATDGSWQDYRSGHTPLFPQCAPAPEVAQTSYVVPAELDPGAYVICLTFGPDEDGCGRLSVTSPGSSTDNRGTSAVALPPTTSTAITVTYGCAAGNSEPAFIVRVEGDISAPTTVEALIDGQTVAHVTRPAVTDGNHVSVYYIFPSTFGIDWHGKESTIRVTREDGVSTGKGTQVPETPSACP